MGDETYSDEETERRPDLTRVHECWMRPTNGEFPAPAAGLRFGRSCPRENPGVPSTGVSRTLDNHLAGFLDSRAETRNEIAAVPLFSADLNGDTTRAATKLTGLSFSPARWSPLPHLSNTRAVTL